MNNIQEILDKIASSPIATTYNPTLEVWSRMKPVYQYDLQGNFIGMRYIKELRKSGFQHISNALRNHISCKGYYFSYEPITDIESYKANKSKTKDQYIKLLDVYDIEGNFLFTMDRQEFTKKYNIRSVNVSTYFLRNQKTLENRFIIRVNEGEPLLKIEPPQRMTKNIKIGKFTIDGNLIEEYESEKTASEKNGVPHSTMNRWIKNNFVKNNCVFKKIP